MHLFFVFYVHIKKKKGRRGFRIENTNKIETIPNGPIVTKPISECLGQAGLSSETRIVAIRPLSHMMALAQLVG